PIHRRRELLTNALREAAAQPSLSFWVYFLGLARFITGSTTKASSTLQFLRRSSSLFPPTSAKGLERCWESSWQGLSSTAPLRPCVPRKPSWPEPRQPIRSSHGARNARSVPSF